MTERGELFGPAFGPWLESRILEDSSELLVVDKPSGIPTHGGDAELASDVVSRLSAFLRARAEDATLFVHQRLDQGTSGVLSFVRSRELSPRVQGDFEAGAAKKRYVAAVSVAPGSALAKRDELLLTHRIDGDVKQRRVVGEGGKLCRATCRVLTRSHERALVELHPETGRTHQLRVQLQAIGAPIAGDVTYGGARAARLMLHAASLELPSVARRYQAPVPPSFARWVAGAELELGSPAELEQKLWDAASRRYPLLGQTSVLRWVNAAGDELPGVEVDLYAGFASLSLSSDESLARGDELAQALLRAGAKGVYTKRRARTDLRHADHAELAPKEPLCGVAAPLPHVVHEGPLAIEVELWDGLSTGLFVDQRDNRRRVSELASGKRVLNLFSYTCSFSVAAALGGAAEVTSVDLSRRALRRGEHNFRLNALDPSLHGFVCEDAVRFLERASTRGQRFDLVILDPPSFSTAGKGKVLRVSRDYPRLVRLVLEVLADGGQLLAVTNHRGTSEKALRRMLLAEAEALGKRVLQAKLMQSGLDCPPSLDGPAPSKSALLTLTRPESKPPPRHAKR